MSEAEEYLVMKLVKQVDCTVELGADEYFSCGESRVVESSAGRYREAAPQTMSRFGYRLCLEPGKPYMLKVRYPDDKKRFMLIGDGTTYDLSFAVITGGVWPVSGKMAEIDEIFWPRFSDLSICFLSWSENETAAVSGFEIYELDESELSPPQVESLPGRRTFGMQYEDPAGTGASEGAADFSTWQKRVIEYLKFTGQNTFSYPLCWYHGPWVPVEGEKADCFSICVNPHDRKQYLAWTGRPDDWADGLIGALGRENIDFTGVFTLLRLPSLMEKFSTREDLRNRLCNDQLQNGTMDWTVIYNTGIFSELLRSDDLFDIKNERTFAYGEKSGQPVQAAPIFNCLHPEVQEHIKRFFVNVCRKYAGHANFKGISVTMWAPTMLWFGSLRSGYDDWTIAAFEAYSGIKLPFSGNDPERFSKRYDYLLYHCRETWIDFRCRKVREFLTELSSAMRAVRDDLKLNIVCWNEPFVPAVRGNFGVEHQIRVRTEMNELYREAGLDISLFAPGDKVDFTLQSEGGGRDRTPSRFMPQEEAFHMFRDHDYLDDSFWSRLKTQPDSGVYVFNAWHEAWGDHRWYDDGETPSNGFIPSTYGKADNYHRMNSFYEPDGFWWESQLRIAPATPPDPHYMEFFSHALYAGDAKRLTCGGLYMDKVHYARFRSFAATYRRILRQSFRDPEGFRQDPVCVRYYSGASLSQIYLVNREYYPVQVEFEVNGSPVQTALGAYELKLLEYDTPVTVSGVICHTPEEIKAQLEEDFRQLLEIAAARNDVPVNWPWAKQEMEKARENGDFARWRKLLTSYPAVKLRRLAQEC